MIVQLSHFFQSLTPPSLRHPAPSIPTTPSSQSHLPASALLSQAECHRHMKAWRKHVPERPPCHSHSCTGTMIGCHHTAISTVTHNIAVHKYTHVYKCTQAHRHMSTHAHNMHIHCTQANVHTHSGPMAVKIHTSLDKH